MRVRNITILIGLCLGLVACGQVGPLTQRPGEKPSVQPAGIQGLTAY